MTSEQKAARAFIEKWKSFVGYHEKATNAQLESFTANSGSNNWNMFAAFIDSLRDKGLNFYNGRKNIGPLGEWCDSSYDAVMIWFVQSLGFDEIEAAKIAMQMLYQPENSCGAGCEFSANYYRAAGAWREAPEVGHQIFFGKKHDESHTGAVTGWDETYVYTIEGNANNQVEERKYRRDDPKIVGYGRPKWEIVAYKFADPEPVPEPVPPYPKQPFVDVPADAWYAADVQWAYENGITYGVDATHFKPDEPCTRAQVVTFIRRAVGMLQEAQNHVE